MNLSGDRDEGESSSPLSTRSKEFADRVSERLQYLFAAIDARQARLRETQKGSAARGSRPPRPKYNSLDLKRLVIEASEAVVRSVFTLKAFQHAFAPSRRSLIASTIVDIRISFRTTIQDDKSAANDFQDTLERIVNEIKNTTVSSSSLSSSSFA